MPTTHDGGGESRVHADSKKLSPGAARASSSKNSKPRAAPPPPTSGAAAPKQKIKGSVYAQVCRQKAVADFETAPKRRRGDPPDSCGKLGDPHNLDDGELVSNPYTRSKKAQRRLASRIVGGGGLTRSEIGDA